MKLPHDLLHALTTVLEGTSQRSLTATVYDLSLRYREGHGMCDEPLIQSDTDVAAYLAYRLPATYAAIAAALHETRDRQPDLVPASLLDLGGGPGTAAWAATAIWPSIKRITVLERDPHMIRMGKALAAEAGSAVIRGIRWRETDVLTPWKAAPADITVAGYMLGELPEASRAGFIQRLWEDTRETGLIIEPGTPRGWAIVRDAGTQLAGAGAEIVAPFPWTWRCVENDNDWCHFSERVPRTHLHRVSKDAELAYEDERYTYVAASRRPGTPIAARVIRHPQVRKGHIRLVLCTVEGVTHTIVTRSDRDAFRRAKHLTWGSAILEEDDLPS